MATLWDITLATSILYTFTLNYAGGAETNNSGMCMSPDGTKMYTATGFGQTSPGIEQYDLSVAFDLSTASYSGNRLTTINYAMGLACSSDGMHFYTTSNTTKLVYQHDLTVAWDLSTATANVASISTGADAYTHMHMSPDGTKLFWLSSFSLPNYLVHQYTLGTAWDITTLSSTTNTMSISAETASAPGDLCLSPDGTKVFVWANDNKVYRYDLSVAWDLTSKTYVSASPATIGSFGLWVSPDGSRLYSETAGSPGSIQEYNMVSFALSGTVKDPSGAVIPNAEVHILNTTNIPYIVEANVTADGSGIYTLTGLTSNTDTFQVVTFAAGPPRRFGASDINLTAT